MLWVTKDPLPKSPLRQLLTGWRGSVRGVWSQVRGLRRGDLALVRALLLSFFHSVGSARQLTSLGIHSLLPPSEGRIGSACPKVHSQGTSSLKMLRKKMVLIRFRKCSVERLICGGCNSLFQCLSPHLSSLNLSSVFPKHLCARAAAVSSIGVGLNLEPMWGEGGL